MLRKLAFYAAILAFFAGSVLVMLRIGGGLPVERRGQLSLSVAQTSSAEFEAGQTDLNIWGSFKENLKRPLGLLILQILVIVPTALGFGFLFKKLGQPSVMGEIFAGILLGPSFVGHLFPNCFQFVFPPASLDHLQMLSQIGILLFMFVVGMELDAKALLKEAHSAVVISHASIIAPFLLGMFLALFLFGSYAPPQISFSQFSLFMGIAMSITAFPVLARIIREKGLASTRVGTIALTCAAVDDVTAWSLLAIIVAVAESSSTALVWCTIALALVFVFFMLYGVKRFLSRILANEMRKDSPRGMILAGVLMVMFGAALFTEFIGIHALFGAFLSGVVMPDDAKFRNWVRQRLENFGSVLLLPIFFAWTGLHTQMGLLNNANAIVTTCLIIAVATAGKFGGSFLAARVSGMNSKDSSAIGILMNTRGLMELVVLNIGYEMGILSPEIFTMMVFMALVTTFMAGPILHGLGILSTSRTR